MQTHDPSVPVDQAESQRLYEDTRRERNWKRWGPYLPERQWATVREDYSEDGECWTYFPHDHARSRAYRWGEDGLLGLCDRQCRTCFAIALWNGHDPILKERLFGLTGLEGNHGEDVKETYFYIDATPTHSYMKALYKYPQRAFPYAELVEVNRRRGRDEPEFDLEETGVFDDGRYFDVFVEYAKAGPEDILVRYTIVNRGPEAASLTVLPTLWCRNTWSWGRSGEEHWPKPEIRRVGSHAIAVEHESLGAMRLDADMVEGADAPVLLFTENETNTERLFGSPNASRFVKDAFHSYLIDGRHDSVNPAEVGTKAAFVYRLEVAAGASVTLRVRLSPEPSADSFEPFGASFDAIFARRIEECDAFHAGRAPASATPEERAVMRQAYAGLLWSKQFYHYVVRDWLEGDPSEPKPPPARLEGRNSGWKHVYNRDVLSVPDKWEYPWYAGWDLAFHMVAFARIDPEFAKEQLLLFLREWYMHPNGQLPAYEFNFSDVNPPVHAWAAWRVYRRTVEQGHGDRRFLARVFQKLLLNFTWWVNRKDTRGNNLFSGGFLGLDNIGVFDRSKPLPTGGYLEQADGTAWMAFYCATMLRIALELARDDIAYEDLASKFFEHFVAITDAMNSLGRSGLWDEKDGFYYDQLVLDSGRGLPLRVRSMVGLIPLFAAVVIEDEELSELPGFTKRMKWFLENRRDLARHISYMVAPEHHNAEHRLLAIPSRERLQCVLRYLLDENEFLSPFGVRSLSRAHREQPYVFRYGGEEFTVRYVSGESDTGLFGGNSNWRGPIWMPVNYLLIEALETYHHFYGDSFRVECPVGSGRMLTLRQVARELASRLTKIFLPDAQGRRPCNRDLALTRTEGWRGLIPFHEYFDGDTGRGCGASHQTGWTSLVVGLVERVHEHD